MILVISDIRALSLAELEKLPRFTKAMVQRMTRMVMTTMSSTRVKPFFAHGCELRRTRPRKLRDLRPVSGETGLLL